MPEPTSSPSRAERLIMLETLVWGVLASWLFLSVWLVRLEYYDGMDSILNARYFTGQIPGFTATRGPLVGLLLMPAEWFRQVTGAHPLEFRPHHAVMAVVHFLSFYLTFVLLRRRFGRSSATLLAFLASVPSFIVISYLPFVSHDLFPGALLLGMVVTAAAFMASPTPARWIALAALGAAAALTKHVLGVFWIALLIALLPAWRSRDGRRRWLLLVGAAAASAAATWLVMCLCLSDVFPDTPWWLRARDQLDYLSGAAHDQSRPEPWWVYLRNLPAFGVVAMTFAIPGWWMARKGTPDQRLAAWTWLILLVTLHLLPLRQVRYLAFLAPLTAYLIQPVFTEIVKRKVALIATLLALLVEFLPLHPYSRIGEAARILTPFYNDDVFRRFFAPIEPSPGRLQTPVYIHWRMLSFAPDRTPPLPGDIYHDLFHFGYHHLWHLYGLRPGDLVFITEEELNATDWSSRTGAVIVSLPGIQIHRTGWRDHETDHRDTLQQFCIPLGAKSAPPAGP